MAKGYGLLGVGHVGAIGYRNPAYSASSWNLDRDFEDVVGVVEGVYDFGADTDDLVRYLTLGKKLIVWNGTDDTLISHYETVRNFEELARASGPDGRKNMGLYLLPGVGHCAGGAGADTFDSISAPADWVENNRVPETLPAAKLNTDGSVKFTRPLCQYPKLPYYNSQGDPNDASSFACRSPVEGNEKK